MSFFVTRILIRDFVKNFLKILYYVLQGIVVEVVMLYNNRVGILIVQIDHLISVDNRIERDKKVLKEHESIVVA